MTFGLGHEVDDAGETERILERPIRDIVGALPVVVGNTIDHRVFCEWVWNQGPTNSCVSQATMMGLYMRGCVERELGIGPGIPIPSVMHGWCVGQWQGQKEDGVPLERRRATNAGMRVTSFLRALREHGIASAARWPFDVSMVTPNARGEVALDVPLDVDIAASDALLTGDYGASSIDNPRVFDMALSQHHFPVVAIDVCDHFMQLHGADVEYRGLEGRPKIGRHMMVVVGRRPGAKLVKNSYGRDWGDHGYVWLTDELLSHPSSRDGAVITAAPKLSA